MQVTIDTIPHSQQRYETVGDWQFRGFGRLKITVSQMDDERYEFLVGLHELVEAYLCKFAGVSQQAVDDFDMQFEADRGTPAAWAYDEPGDAPEAPYHKQHMFASKIERLVVEELGIDWEQYWSALDAHFPF